MSPEEPLTEQDQAALRHCVKVLKQEPEITYKELRRDAQKTAGLKVRRLVWTLARRELGLRPDGDMGGEGGGEGEEAASERTQRDLRPSAPRPPDDRFPQRDARDEAPWRNERQPWERDDRGYPPRRPPFRDDGPPRGPDFNRPPQRQEPSYGWDAQPPPQDPERRRPAWAQPPPGRGPAQRPPDGPPPAWAQPPARPAPPDPRSVIPPAVTPKNPVEFMVYYLQSVNREATFQEVKDAAEREGYTVYPATFGRAQAIVGIVEAPISGHRRDPLIAPPSSVSSAQASAAPAPSPVRPLEPVATQAATPRPIPSVASAAPASGPTPQDPVEGLLAFMTAADRTHKDSRRMHESMTAMLEVIRRALT